MQWLIIKTKVLHKTKVTSANFWLSCLDPLVFLSTETFKLFGFHIFWLWGTWWRLFQKGVMHT